MSKVIVTSPIELKRNGIVLKVSDWRIDDGSGDVWPPDIFTDDEWHEIKRMTMEQGKARTYHPGGYIASCKILEVSLDDWGKKKRS